MPVVWPATFTLFSHIVFAFFLSHVIYPRPNTLFSYLITLVLGILLIFAVKKTIEAVFRPSFVYLIIISSTVMQKRITFLVAFMLVLATGVMAQITTSALGGQVTMQEDGESVIGATVKAVHEPSGTVYTAVTNINGRFNIQGMRTGGPYSVTVSYIGYETTTL